MDGLDMKSLILGSEGAYGVITEATVSVHPAPAIEDYRAVLFHAWDDGIAAYRELLQSKHLRPSIVWLADPYETSVHAVLSPNHRGWRRFRESFVSHYARLQGFGSVRDDVLMLLGFDGSRGWTAWQWNQAARVCGDHRGLLLGRHRGGDWKQERYAFPHLRDLLIGHQVMVGTIEAATEWGNLQHLYTAVARATKGAISASGGGRGLVMTHIGHASSQAASLEVVFLGRQVADPDPLARQAQWLVVKQAAASAALAAGGNLSYYSGNGPGQTQLGEQEVRRIGSRLLKSLKRTLDPGDTMSSGIASIAVR
jgi:alkyldihydroxyacetonephosphate synthase